MGLQVLSCEDIQRIHEMSLELLESNGIWFHDCPEAVEIFNKNGCNVDGYRVQIPRQVVQDCLASVPDRDNLKLCVTMLGFGEPIGLKKGEAHVGMIGNPYYLHEHGKGHRNVLESDLDDKDCVLDNLPNIEFDCCGIIPESHRQAGGPPLVDGSIDQYIDYLRRVVHNRPSPNFKNPPLRVSIPQGRREFHPLSSITLMTPFRRIALLRHAIVRGPAKTEALLKQDTPFVWVNPVSPMQQNPWQMRVMIETIKKYGTKCYAMISPEVMCGATGPVTMSGALAQHNAEVLSVVILTQLCKPGAGAIYGCVSGISDMRTADISLGNFESQIFNVAAVQLADHYGLPCRISSGNTSAKETGVRAAVELSLGVQMGMAAGANIITTGLLDSTLMVSYEHMVLLNELVNQFKSGLGATITDDKHLARDVLLAEAHPSPNYIGNSHTFEWMKEAVYYSDYTGRVEKSYEDWYDLAHKQVKEILERKVVDDKEDKVIAERLAAVEARLREDSESWRTGDGDWWRPYLQ